MTDLQWESQHFTNLNWFVGYLQKAAFVVITNVCNRHLERSNLSKPSHFLLLHN